MAWHNDYPGFRKMMNKVGTLAFVWLSDLRRKQNSIKTPCLTLTPVQTNEGRQCTQFHFGDTSTYIILNNLSTFSVDRQGEKIGFLPILLPQHIMHMRMRQ